MPLSIRCATFNLRYDSKPDSKSVKDSLAALPSPLDKPSKWYDNPERERPWSERRIRVWQQLSGEQLDVIGFQESLHRQTHDLDELLNRDEPGSWRWVGVGRDDGEMQGEYSPIFWRTSRFDMVSWDTFWLSKTHKKPSKFPGAGSVRLCTVVRLRSKDNGGLISVLNTHLDDQSEPQRRYGASMLRHRALYEEQVYGSSVVLFGDFNSPPDRSSDSGAYLIATGALSPVDLDSAFTKEFEVPASTPRFTLLDFRGETPAEAIHGHFATYTDWSQVRSTGPYNRIDFIFGGSGSGWRSVLFKTRENLTDDGVYSSDHRLVVAHLEL
ncbi:mannose-6-phosphatase [Auriculariales sp. MPI-PUGE-AT-0066]|nr:mannose-6-phosphatase [Auriculariales sp. MPI-PUGE-AT-0066]